MMWTAAGVLCFITTALAQTSHVNYTVTAPSNFRPGYDYDITVSIGAFVSSSVTVTASIRTRDSWRDPYNTIIVENSRTFPAGQIQNMQLQVPDVLTNYDFQLWVSGTGGVTFNHTESISKAWKTKSVFIQTSQGIYKPESLVRFRAFATNADMIPLPGPYNVYLIDPNDNRLAQWLDVELTTDMAFVSGEYELSEEPPYGTWSIEVHHGETVETKTFKVEEYVLPKFEVTVKLPSYVVEQMENIRGTLEAKYTFGQGVDGPAFLECYLQNYYYRSGNDRPRLRIELDKGSDTGVHDFVIPLAQLNTLQRQQSWYGNDWEPTYDNIVHQRVTCDGNVTEALTGKSITGSGTVRLERSPLKMEWLQTTPSSFKPGMPLYAFLKLTQADDTPPTAQDLMGRQIQMDIRITDTSDAVDTHYSDMVRSYTARYYIDVPVTGIIIYPVPVPANAQSLTLTPTFTDRYGGTVNLYGKTIQRYKTRDDQTIQISMLNEEKFLKVGQELQFMVNSTFPLTEFTYYVIGKGEIAYQETINAFGSQQLQFILPFDRELAQVVGPSAKLLGQAYTTGGELVVDALMISVEATLPNEVTMEFSTNQTKPGTQVSLDIIAHRDSYVGLLAIDTSLELLASGNDLLHDDVMTELQGYDVGGNYGPWMYFARMPGCGWWWPFYPGGTDAAQTLQNVGLIVMTDAHVEKDNYHGTPYYPMAVDDGMMMARGRAGPAGPAPAGERGEAGFAGARGPSGQRGEAGLAGPADLSPNDVDRDQLQEATRVRSNFAETWIWSDTAIGPDGHVTLTYDVPDTMTSWVANAIAVHPSAGVGVPKERAMLTVFKPFFVVLDLPYSIIRGEIFVLKANVFNYMEETQTVLVTLKESSDFQTTSSHDIDPTYGSLEVALEIPAGTAETASFIIYATSLGQIPIRVMGQSYAAADALERNLLVEAEGYPQESSEAVLIDLTDGSETFTTDFEINFPSSLVPGSQFISLSAQGDLLAKTINNIGGLIQMPYGCGEQNMVNFVPNILVLKYFDTTDQGEEADIRRATTYMARGYQRQNNYRRSDGSYSAFGNSDQHGGTWLTAFVLKSFRQAIDVSDIITSVGRTQMAATAQFLINRQQHDGDFEELHTVHSSYLRGGSFRGLALAAYVLVALEEVEDMEEMNNINIQTAIANARSYVENEWRSNIDDPYTLAIVSYALGLSGSSAFTSALQALNQMKTSEDGVAYWRDPDTDHDEDERYYCYYCHPSFEVEMTAYGIMANLLDTAASLSDVIPMIRWLVAQQNSNGGFRSTQDTVVGLQALTEFAMRAYGGSYSDRSVALEVVATTPYTTETHSFETISTTNALLLQQIDLEDDTVSVTVTGFGTGLATVQLSTKFNTFVRDPSSDIVVTVSSSTVNGNGNNVQLHTCAQWMNQDSSSGMANIDINALSGYVFNTEGLLDQYSSIGLKRVELKEKKLSTYWEQLTLDSTCIDVLLERVNDVSNIQQAQVMAYSYYRPDTVAVASYLPTALQGVVGGQCEICPSCCNPGVTFRPTAVPGPTPGNGATRPPWKETNGATNVELGLVTMLTLLLISKFFTV